MVLMSEDTARRISIRPPLHGIPSRLPDAKLPFADLTEVWLNHADLSSATIDGADLSENRRGLPTRIVPGEIQRQGP